MNVAILKVKPNSRFHFGKVALDVNTGLLDTSEIIHSDILYNALISNIAQLGDTEKVDCLIGAFKNGNIVLSSGFFCIEKKENDFSYLLPRPVHAQNYIETYEDIKKVKAIKFVSPEVLQTNPREWVIESKTSVLFSEDGKKHFDSDIKLYSKEVVPNVNVHPTNENSRLYNTAFIQIAELKKNEQGNTPLVHFYFMYEFSGECSKEVQDLFKFSVELIEINGLGGERSSGFGFIEDVVFDPNFELPEIKTTFQKMSVGLFIPTKEEFAGFKHYNYITRGGRRTAKGGELQRVRMLTEGAVLESESNPKGTWVNLNRESTEEFLRFGKSLTIQIPDYDTN
jgi:CRISPR-associated protein Csm4